MNRADKMHAALKDGRPKTRRELFAHADAFYLTNNAASELRARGFTVSQWRDGEDFVYQLGSLEEATVLRGDSTLSTAAAASSSEHAGLAETPSAHAAPVRARSLSGCGEGEQLTLAAA